MYAHLELPGAVPILPQQRQQPNGTVTEQVATIAAAAAASATAQFGPHNMSTSVTEESGLVESSRNKPYPERDVLTLAHPCDMEFRMFFRKMEHVTTSAAASVKNPCSWW